MPVQARAQKKVPGQRVEGEAHKEERRWEEGQGSWEGQGSKINRPLFSAGNECPGFSLPVSGIQSCIRGSLSSAAGAHSNINLKQAKVKRLPGLEKRKEGAWSPVACGGEGRA